MTFGTIPQVSYRISVFALTNTIVANPRPTAPGCTVAGDPSGIRVWCGASMDTGELNSLLEWLEWAYHIVTKGHGQM